MYDRYGAHVGISRCTAHRIAANGCKGGNQVGNHVHGMIGKHATHRETRQVDTVTVDIVFFDHFIDQGLDEINVAAATDIPALVDAVGKNGDKLRRIGNRFYNQHAFLIGSILIHAVTRNEQRTLGSKFLWNIDNIVTLDIVDCDFFSHHRHRQQSH